MDITSCIECGREIFIIDDNELEKNIVCVYCKREEKERNILESNITNSLIELDITSIKDIAKLISERLEE